MAPEFAPTRPGEKDSDIESSSQVDLSRPGDIDSTDAKLAALATERNNLRLEVTELRKSLESISAQHAANVSALQAQLVETQEGRESAESSYRSLLGKVNTIKAQLGERLKSDAVCTRSAAAVCFIS